MGSGRRVSMLPCGQFRVSSYAIHGGIGKLPRTADQ